MKTISDYHKKKMGPVVLRDHITLDNDPPRCVKEHLANFPYKVYFSDWPDKLRIADFSIILSGAGFCMWRIKPQARIIEWMEERKVEYDIVMYSDGKWGQFIAAFLDINSALEFKLTWT